MKKIRYSIYAVLLSLSFIACESETTEPIIGTTTPAKQIQLSFSDNNNNANILEDGGEITYTVNVSEALTDNAKVRLAINSTDNSIESTEGLMEVNYIETTLKAGEKSIDVTLNFVNDNLDDLSESYTVVVDFLETDNSEKYIFTSGDDNLRTVNVYDHIVNTTDGDVEILLDWKGTEDMDLYLINSSFQRIDYSWDYQPEEMTFLSTYDDGIYYIGIDNFGVTGSVNMPASFSLTFPDGNKKEIFSTYIVEDANDNVDTFYTLTKITNDNNDVTYLIGKL